MIWFLRLVLSFFFWVAVQGTIHAEPFGEEATPIYFSCGYSTFTAYYKAKVSTYYFSGACLHSTSQVQVPWSATGTYEPATAYTTETVTVSGVAPNRGTLTSTMTCAGLRENQDPWLTKVICGSFSLKPQGDLAGQKLLLDAIYKRMQSRGGPLTSSFPYDRNVLLAKRDADLKEEAVQIQAAAAAQRKEQQLLQGAAQSSATSYIANLSPTIIGPVVGQQFYNQSPVAIKLAMPKGFTVSSYLVKLQRKDASGKWLDHANLPVGAVQAESAAGYTGFGAGAPPAFLSLPGAWRLAAQASYPKQSGWSDWREFFVVAALHPAAKTRVTR